VFKQLFKQMIIIIMRKLYKRFNKRWNNGGQIGSFPKGVHGFG